MIGALAEPLALYVHWPFCASKCPYCDFNSHVRPSVEHGRWRAALLSELRRVADEAPDRTITSIFFGGGTPSLMEPATVAALLEEAARLWNFAPDIEITLEANPGSAEAGRFAGFAAAGVNRISLGVQALDDASLAFLGRRHSAAEALAAVALARAAVPRISFDLIYARPGQSVAAWERELRRALEEGVTHLSAYQLTIEPGTRFAMLAASGQIETPDEELGADLYESTQSLLTAAGLPAYEVSNHAAPSAECRHNLATWRYQDYAGIGPGAHGRLTLRGDKVATRAHRAPEVWLERVERGLGAETREPVSSADRLTEALMMGLRLREGVPLARLSQETGQAVTFDPTRIARLAEAGLLQTDPDWIVATPAGLQRLNAVTSAVLDAVRVVEPA